MRQWRRRRREDEQQVRRVSGAWPPPRGPFPTTVPCAHPRPHCRRRKLRHRPQSLTRVRSGRPCAASGHEGVRDEGCRGLRDPRVVRTQGEVRCPGGRRWPCGPEGDFGTPRPSAGYPQRGGRRPRPFGCFRSLAALPLNSAFLTHLSGLSRSPFL